MTVLPVSGVICNVWWSRIPISKNVTTHWTPALQQERVCMCVGHRSPTTNSGWPAGWLRLRMREAEAESTRRRQSLLVPREELQQLVLFERSKARALFNALGCQRRPDAIHSKRRTLNQRSTETDTQGPAAGTATWNNTGPCWKGAGLDTTPASVCVCILPLIYLPTRDTK